MLDFSLRINNSPKQKFWFLWQILRRDLTLRIKKIKNMQPPKTEFLGPYLYYSASCGRFTDFRILQPDFKTPFFKGFLLDFRCEFISHPNINFNVMTYFSARIELLGSKISNSYNLQKRYYQASMSIIQRVMAYLLFSGFYNTDFGQWFV